MPIRASLSHYNNLSHFSWHCCDVMDLLTVSATGMEREMFRLPSADYKEHARRIQFGAMRPKYYQTKSRKTRSQLGWDRKNIRKKGKGPSCCLAEVVLAPLMQSLTYLSWSAFFLDWCFIIIFVVSNLWTPEDFRTQCFVMVMWYKEATEMRKYQMHALIVLWIFVLITHFCYPLSIVRAFKSKYHPPSTYRNYSSYC